VSRRHNTHVFITAVSHTQRCEQALIYAKASRIYCCWHQKADIEGRHADVSSPGAYYNLVVIGTKFVCNWILLLKSTRRILHQNFLQTSCLRQTSPRCCHLAKWTKDTHRLRFWPIRYIVWKHEVIHKPEVHNVSNYWQRRTKSRPQVTCTENLMKSGLWFFEICKQTDKQTDKYTDALITILCTAIGAK